MTTTSPIPCSVPECDSQATHLVTWRPFCDDDAPKTRLVCPLCADAMTEIAAGKCVPIHIVPYLE